MPTPPIAARLKENLIRSIPAPRVRPEVNTLSLSSTGHVWNHREVDLGDQPIQHVQCERCGRDFAVLLGDEWVAVYVGALEFLPLDEPTNQRWRNEQCPGVHLPQDANSMRLHRA